MEKALNKIKIYPSLNWENFKIKVAEIENAPTRVWEWSAHLKKKKQVQTIPKSFNMEESQPLGKVSTRELFPSGHFLIRKLPLLKSSEFYIRFYKPCGSTIV